MRDPVGLHQVGSQAHKHFADNRLSRCDASREADLQHSILVKSPSPTGHRQLSEIIQKVTQACPQIVVAPSHCATVVGSMCVTVPELHFRDASCLPSLCCTSAWRWSAARRRPVPASGLRQLRRLPDERRRSVSSLSCETSPPAWHFRQRSVETLTHW